MQAAVAPCHIREQGRQQQQEQQDQHARRLYADVVGQTSGGGAGGNGDGWAAAPARRRPSSGGSSLSHGGGGGVSDDAFSNGLADSWQDDRPDGPLARDQAAAAAAAAAARSGAAAVPKSCLLPRGGGGVYQRSGGGTGAAPAAAAQREAGVVAVASHAAGPVVPKLHGLPQAPRGDDPAAGHAPPLRSARPAGRGGGGGPVGQLREEVEALRKKLERKEEMLLEAQVTSSRLHGDNWKALQAHNDMAQELEATSAAETTARSRLAAVVSTGRQLSRASAAHALAVEAPLAAVHSAMREYHGVLTAMEGAMGGGAGNSRGGTPGSPGTPGDETAASPAVAAAVLTSPAATAAAFASPDAGAGPTAQRAYLQQQIDLRDHIVMNLAAHLGSLEVCIRRGGAETSELATKLVMLAGGTLDN